MLLSFKGRTTEAPPLSRGTVGDLRAIVHEKLGVSPSLQKLLVSGKAISPDVSSDEALPAKLSKVMVLEASTSSQQQIYARASHDAEREREIRATYASRTVKPSAVREQPLEYTFERVEAFGYGDSAKAQQYLDRIRDDKAVQALMKKYKLKVGLLTELDPTANTRTVACGAGQERTLGLNENRGMVIRLRIRTDDYGGFRHYRDTKMVLCHELAHNTFGEHDQRFWDLCKLYEREIEALDPYKGRGHRLDGY